MARYEVNNQLGGTQQNLSSSYKSLVTVLASSSIQARRAFVVSAAFGTNGTPANNELEWDISRVSADGTGTGITCNPLDAADAASCTAGSVNYTAEPTVTSASSLFYMGLNQQASYRWVAIDDRDRLVVPATAAHGFAFRAKSAAYASTATCSVHFDE